MSDDRDKLLGIMNNLESDYRSGKISAEKYSYFRSKYEDKLNSIDARDATKRIRSMQGKPSTENRKKRSKKPTKNKRKQEQDLVQKYIINPKKSDAQYNKKKKSAMDSGTFKLLLLLILVVGFTAGIAYGIFNFDFGTISQVDTVAVVDDTAFPEFKNDVKLNTTTDYDNYTYNYTSNDDNDDIELRIIRIVGRMLIRHLQVIQTIIKANHLMRIPKGDNLMVEAINKLEMDKTEING